MVFDKMCNCGTKIINFVDRRFRDFLGNDGFYRKKCQYMICSQGINEYYDILLISLELLYTEYNKDINFLEIGLKSTII